jgi:hypothetical protein
MTQSCCSKRKNLSDEVVPTRFRLRRRLFLPIAGRVWRGIRAFWLTVYLLGGVDVAVVEPHQHLIDEWPDSLLETPQGETYARGR